MDWIDALPDFSKVVKRSQQRQVAGLEAFVALKERRPEWDSYLDGSIWHLVDLLTVVYAEVKDDQLLERWLQMVRLHLLNLLKDFGEALLEEK